MSTDPRTERQTAERAGMPPEEVAERATLLPAGTWRADPERSSFDFRAKKMGVYYVKGRFRQTEATVELGEDGRFGAEAVVDAASIYTRIPPRDYHLRSYQFLDVKRHPQIRISGDTLKAVGDGSFTMRGSMEIRGTRRPVDLRARRLEAEGGDVARVRLEGMIVRQDFGVKAPAPFEQIVGNDVHLDVELVLRRAA